MRTRRWGWAEQGQHFTGRGARCGWTRSVARRGPLQKPCLPAGYGISLDELRQTAAHQQLTIEKHDILLIRSGWLNRFFVEGPTAYYREDATDESPDTAVQSMSEPGIAYSPELMNYFHDVEIPSLGSDTLASEQTPPSRAVSCRDTAR